MKIRQGFVSNSSSSSFTFVRGNPFDCPIEVAQHMLMERNWPSDTELLKTLRELTRGGQIDRDTNLCFRSTNYNTYIYNNYTDPNRLVICIYTCNNIDWNFPDDVRFDPEDKGYRDSKGKQFLMLESGITGSRTDDEQAVQIASDINKKVATYNLYCRDCSMDLWIDKGNFGEIILCPQCGKQYFVKANTPGSVWK
jgi:hypothetical protein